MFGRKKLKKEIEKLKNYIDSYEEMLQGCISRSASISRIGVHVKLQGGTLISQESVNNLLIDEICQELSKPENIQKCLHITKEDAPFGCIYNAEIKIVTK